jgi:hypothetical protein
MADVRDLVREAVGSFEPVGDERGVEHRLRRRHRRQQVSAAIVALGLLAGGGLLAWTALGPSSSSVGSSSGSPTPPAGEIFVPDVVGLAPAEARASMDSLGLTVLVTMGTSDQAEAGLVLAQDPPPGVSVSAGTRVTIVVNGGAPVGRPRSVGDLPAQGVAVGSGTTVQLVGLDGTVLATLPGYSIAGNPGAPGVWLLRGEEYFLLDVDEGALVPVAAAQARAVSSTEGPEPAVASPQGASGHWRYAVDSPSGITLAQWSGECEVPTAYWIAGDAPPRILTGESDLAKAPESLALGWSSDGEAVVLVGGGTCGVRSASPGIYLYTRPGDGRLVASTADVPVVADAWGTGL